MSYGKLHYAAPREGDRRGLWLITAKPHVAVRLKRLFPRARANRAGAILLLDTPEVARDLSWILQRWPLEIGPAAAANLVAGAAEYDRRQEIVTRVLEGRHEPLPYKEPARPARPYQQAAADLVLTSGRLLLTDELGLGKTFSSLLVLRDPDALPALVVTLTHLPSQWVDEIDRSLPWLKTHIVTSGTAYNPAERRGAVGYPDVLIMNYHKLAGWADHLAGEIRTIIFDEAQELRRAATNKYQAAQQIAGQAQYRMGLTATPVFNYAGEIYNILDVLAPDELGAHEEFCREWCGGDSGWYSRTDPKITVRDPAALGSHLRDVGLMLRRTRVQVGCQLPDVVRVPHTIDIDETRLARLAEGTADLAQMIVEGSGDHTELFRARGELDYRLRHATGVAKARYVAEFVKMLLESGEQVVLFGWHRDVYDIWKEELSGYLPAFYTGEESPRQKELSAKAFLEGTSRVLIMSLRAGAGLDGLQEVAHIAVFGELDWSPGQHEQCIGRLQRDGQEEHVVAYFLVANSGSDPVIAEVLNLKRGQSEPLQTPDGALLTQVAEPDRVLRLAEQVVRRRQEWNN